MNKLIFNGNLTRNAELVTRTVGTEQNVPCCKFSVAVNDVNGRGQKVTTYYDVTLWRKRATSLAPYLTKGRAVLVEGRPEVETWAGNTGFHAKVKIHDAHVSLIGPKPAGLNPTGTEDGSDDIDDIDVINDEDALPFV